MKTSSLLLPLRWSVYCVALLLAAYLRAGETESVQSGDTESAPPTTDESWFKKISSISGEYAVEETYVGEASVRNGRKLVNDYDEHDTLLRLVLTPRAKIGVLRLGVEWERFSFGFPTNTPLPNTLQSGSLVLGLDTQLSDSILLRVQAQPGFYGTTDFTSNNFSVPFIAGGTYIYNPNLQFVAGVSVDIERQYPVIPAAGIRWKIARQWVLNAILPEPVADEHAKKDEHAGPPPSGKLRNAFFTEFIVQ